MLLEEKAKNPDTKLMLFLLSDGETNSGLNMNKISAINEAASINADSDDVVYKLKNLFDAQM